LKNNTEVTFFRAFSPMFHFKLQKRW